MSKCQFRPLGFLAAISLLVLGCSDQPMEPEEALPTPNLAHKPGHGGGGKPVDQTVFLTATVADAAAEGFPTRRAT